MCYALKIYCIRYICRQYQYKHSISINHFLSTYLYKARIHLMVYALLISEPQEKTRITPPRNLCKPGFLFMQKYIILVSCLITRSEFLRIFDLFLVSSLYVLQTFCLFK